MVKSRNTQAISLQQIIRKYSEHRFLHSAAKRSDARLELLGFICENICLDKLPSQIVGFLEKNPLQANVLTQEEINFLLANSIEAADLICAPSDKIGFESYELMQPVELTKLATTALLSVPQGTVVYNPFAGCNSYAIAAPQYHFVGEELNYQTWALGKMRLLLHGIDADIVQGDSYTDRKGEQFNAIIATPPFGILDEVDTLMQLYGMLEEGGKLVIISPLSILNSLRAKSKFRETVIKERALHTIVQIPPRILADRGTAPAMIVLEKKPHDSVRMIDITDFVVLRKSRTVSIDSEHLESICEWIKGTETEKDNHFVDVSYDNIVRHRDLTLLPSSYLAEAAFEARNIKNLVPLQQLVKSYYARLDISGEKARIVKIRDLSDNVLNSVKDFSDLPLENPDEFPYVLKKDDLLLIANAGTNPKPTLFKYKEGEPFVCVGSNISIFELDTDLVGMEYIVSELHKPYAQEQFNAAFSGAYISHITTDKLLDIKISLPSLDKRDISAEEKSINAYRLEVQEEIIKQAGIQLKELQDLKHDKYVKIMHQRKHALNQVLNVLEPAIHNIQRAMARNNGTLHATDYVSSRSTRTVEASLENIHSQVLRLVDMVYNLTVDTEFSAPEEVSLYGLLQHFQKNLVDDHYEFNIVYETEYGFTTDKSQLIESGKKYRDYKVSFAPTEFIQVLDNITSNAIKYGFKDPERLYMIQVSTMPTKLNGKEAVEIRIANNGAPLAKGMTPEKVFAQGISSGKGDGLGGWHTKNIVEYYEGKIDLIENDSDSDFRIEYIIVLPVIESYEL